MFVPLPAGAILRKAQALAQNTDDPAVLSRKETNHFTQPNMGGKCKMPGSPFRA
jgi:hypothetical protein